MAVVVFFPPLPSQVSAVIPTAHLCTYVLETKRVRGKLCRKVLDKAWDAHVAVFSWSWSSLCQGWPLALGLQLYMEPRGRFKPLWPEFLTRESQFKYTSIAPWPKVFSEHLLIHSQKAVHSVFKNVSLRIWSLNVLQSCFA